MISFCEFVKLVEAAPIINRYPPYLSPRNRSRWNNIQKFNAVDAQAEEELGREAEKFDDNFVRDLFNELPKDLQEFINSDPRWYEIWVNILRSNRNYTLKAAIKAAIQLRKRHNWELV